MGTKSMHIVATFATTSAAMAVQAASEAGTVPGRMIPIPAALSAGCGLAWCAPIARREELRDALDAAGLAYEGLFLVELAS